MSSTANVLYDQDFYAWTQEQAKLIKAKDFDRLDIDHLFEEVEDMGNRHADELESRFKHLLSHLLKWKYQPTHRGTSWESTIREQRKSIEKRLIKNPSLKSRLHEIFSDAYDMAIYEASAESNLPYKAFPTSCEWDMNQALDTEFFPS